MRVINTLDKLERRSLILHWQSLKLLSLLSQIFHSIIIVTVMSYFGIAYFSNYLLVFVY